MCSKAKIQPVTVVPPGMLLIRRLYHPVEGQTDEEYPIAYTRRNLASLAQEHGQGQSVLCLVNGHAVPREQWKHIRPKLI